MGTVPSVPKPRRFPSPSVSPLTQRHDGEIFAPKFAGDFNFLTKRPTVLGVGVMGGGRRVVAHLGGTRGQKPALATPIALGGAGRSRFGGTCSQRER